jgi:hypothetical protein
MQKISPDTLIRLMLATARQPCTKSSDDEWCLEMLKLCETFYNQGANDLAIVRDRLDELESECRVALRVVEGPNMPNGAAKLQLITVLAGAISKASA